MKFITLLAYASACTGIISCQPDSNPPRADPKKTPTQENTSPKGDPTTTTPAAPASGDGTTAPTTPGATTPSTGGTACSAKEAPIPKGNQESAYRFCCDKLGNGKACMDKTKNCWIAGVLPMITKAFKSGTCPKPPASASLQLDGGAPPQ